MRETDAFFWTMEKDPALRMTVVAVALLDGVPDWAEVVRRMEAVSRAAPMFRQRVVATPAGLATPKWVTDDRFDITWHVRRVALPSPAGLGSLLELAAQIGTTAFDPARPRWEVWLVEGLDGGRCAWVAKVHHTLSDGIGGTELLTHIFDVDGVPLASTPAPTAPVGGGADTWSLLRSAAGHHAGRALDLVRGATAVTARTLAAARRSPRDAAAGAGETWRTLLESVAPTSDKRSPIMTARGLSRHYATLDLRLGDLRDAAHVAGGTVNDAFLTGVTGGLRRYHERHAAVIPQLRLALPISVRRPGDPEAGNRIALVRLDLPLHPVDPRRRMSEIGRRTQRWKDAPGLAYIEAAYALVNTLPARYLQGLAKHVDFVASNVPGLPMPVRLAGPRLEALYAFGPTGGTAVNLTMVSYAGAVHLGIDADAEAVPDLDVLVGCLRESFDEVVAMAPRRRRGHATAHA